MPEAARRDGATQLDGATEQLYATTDPVEIESVPSRSQAQGIVSRGQHAEEPLGRRIPQPLEASREGIER